MTDAKDTTELESSLPIALPGENAPEILADPHGIGHFLRFTATKTAARHIFEAGEVRDVDRFTCCHRYEPFWMEPSAGTDVGTLPKETQFLLVQRTTGDYAIFVPLVDGVFRASLQGAGEGEQKLQLLAQTGDLSIVGAGMMGLFVATGKDPYALVEASAQSVCNWMGTGRLRKEKPLPPFVDSFGWCTWDAFYSEVSHDKVREGLQSFAEGGVSPRYLILDDGWQSTHNMPSGEQRVTGFSANHKFPGDLAPTVQMAKGEFGINTFLVWHALTGHWGGVDPEHLPGYGVRSVPRDFAPEILEYRPTFHDWFGRVVGLVSPDHIYRFFHDYHRHLRKQGVDGVKVDGQAVLEGIAAGSGGRVALMQRYHEALEGSVLTHFGDSEATYFERSIPHLINCMSCASEMLYATRNSNLTRTSTDFWPLKPESHGLHVYTNAQVSLWFGEFTHADWDMFQSGHEMGSFHAAARAVGGCPVYVSDKPGQHDFDLLKKLVCSNGSILRADNLGRPTLDCLFHDPTKEDVLLKIFNTNGLYGDSDARGVIGVFNTRYAADSELAPITGSISPSDVWGLEGERFAVYAHNAKTLTVLNRDERQEITLAPLTFEIFTIALINDGFAPIGLVEMLNSGGGVGSSYLIRSNEHSLVLRGAGEFFAWSERTPTQVRTDQETVLFDYDPDSHRLRIQVPVALLDADGDVYLHLHFA